jgi:hypothetical protein
VVGKRTPGPEPPPDMDMLDKDKNGLTHQGLFGSKSNCEGRDVSSIIQNRLAIETLAVYFMLYDSARFCNLQTDSGSRRLSSPCHLRGGCHKG